MIDVVVPPGVPDGFALVYTTIEFEGRLNEATAAELMDVVRERFGIEATLTTCQQIHSASARRATPEGRWRECDACDALWSTERHTALGIKVADCLPVTIIDPAGHVIANIHSGWRGAVQNIVGKTLDAIPIDPAKSIAFLGPSIRVCCFEVGEEVVEAVLGARRSVLSEHSGPSTEHPIVNRDLGPKPHVDIPAYTSEILREHGITTIVDTGWCTRCPGSRFHSFRRDPERGGRNLAIVAQ